MEKQYFKYGTGYVNIDNENLYLTNSGNWQEARELKEKDSSTKINNLTRIKNRNKGFIPVILIAFSIFTDSIIMASVMIAIAVLLFFILNIYYRRDLGIQYKIPFSKIESVEKYEKGIKISFRNKANENDSENINGIEPRGFEILKQKSLLKN
ncbi:hypothetical protein [Flavobacterium beibuense]|uniref:hypothetical protein n=1 Tax=Flavobacterium beibuense TaxID=657326 RepID=UPI003A937511